MISEVNRNGGTVTLGGTLNSGAYAGFIVDVYAVSTPDASGHGQASAYLGSTVVKTGPNGTGMFTFQTNSTAASFSATATAADGSTSEFSLDPPALSVSQNASTSGQAVTYTFTLTNQGTTPLAGVLLTDNLLPRATNASTTQSTGAASVANGVATFSVGTLAAGAQATLSLTETVPLGVSTANNVGRISVPGSGVQIASQVGAVGVKGDYDGDGKADIGVYRPDDATWHMMLSGAATQATAAYGWAGHDVPIPGDYDGDGKTDVAVFRPETDQWFLNRSNLGATSLSFGWPGHDTPVPAGYDANTQAEVAVYRPESGQWFILHDLTKAGNPAYVQTVNFGWINRDKPVPGDFEGVGYNQLAVFRPDTGDWFFYDVKAGKMDPSINLGYSAGDVPVPGDYDGIGRDEPAVYRPGTGQFLIYNPITNVIRTVAFGNPVTDVPVPEDYSGDGKVDVAVYTPGTAVWRYLDSTTGQTITVNYGWAGHDVALPGPLSYRVAFSDTLGSVSVPTLRGLPTPGSSSTDRSPFPTGDIAPTSSSTLTAMVAGGHRKATRPAVASTTPFGPLGVTWGRGFGARWS